MIFRACFVLMRSVARGLARVSGRPDRRVRIVRLLPHGVPHQRPAPLRLAHDAHRSGEARRAGPGPK
ncbi:hypothetical protein [Inquilinus sp. Marseille-Q2685]|uniref:hypothetical protein n=1 Tax=Inquilinus sp. Marseille-Q2685 TaxID=2866581 RepID=UPI001CE3EB4E|nr:hypothetical protein [Inquilinus sp. Marseille-Q2685]